MLNVMEATTNQLCFLWLVVVFIRFPIGQSQGTAFFPVIRLAMVAVHERIKWITYAWQMSFQSDMMSKISRSLTRDTGAH